MTTMNDRLDLARRRCEAAATREPEHAPWLELARQQSRSLAEARAAHSVPLRWEADAGRARASWLPRLRSAWAVPALAVILLGAATVTLAYVHRQREQRRAVAPGPAATVQPRGEVPRTKIVRRGQRRAAPVREKTVKPVARATETAREAAPASQPLGDVVFGQDEGGSVIIVAPPPRRPPPLWTPEEYRKKHDSPMKW
jgi:hypothetical protein